MFIIIVSVSIPGDLPGLLLKKKQRETLITSQSTVHYPNEHTHTRTYRTKMAKFTVEMRNKVSRNEISQYIKLKNLKLARINVNNLGRAQMKKVSIIYLEVRLKC